MHPKLKAAIFSCVSFSLFFIVSCASSSKTEAPENETILKKLEGKKIALFSVEGEPTQKRIVEVAFVNQIRKHGTFILLSKKEVQKVREDPSIDPRDWKSMAKKSQADFGLRIHILKFEGVTRKGYSRETYYDEQLAEERGEEHGETSRLVVVKSLSGHVKFRLEFFDVRSETVSTEETEAERKVVKEARKKAIQLPPKLRFLEELSNEAFAKILAPN